MADADPYIARGGTSFKTALFVWDGERSEEGRAGAGEGEGEGAGDSSARPRPRRHALMPAWHLMTGR